MGGAEMTSWSVSGGWHGALTQLFKTMQCTQHLQGSRKALRTHLGWRMRLITAASACSWCTTLSGSSSWPRCMFSANS